MISSPTQLAAFCLAPLLLVLVAASHQPTTDRGHSDTESTTHDEEQVEQAAMQVQYLEIVTPAVDKTCEALAAAHGVVFSKPVPELGNARTASLKDGGRIGVRGPMRDTETPVVRPYLLVDDIEAAVKAAEKAGATVALPPMEIPGQGTFSVYILGGIEHGLWQL